MLKIGSIFPGNYLRLLKQFDFYEECSGLYDNTTEADVPELKQGLLKLIEKMEGVSDPSGKPVRHP